MKIKLRLTIVLLLINISFLNSQNVGINEDNSTPDPSAMLDIKSNNKGLLIPRTDTASVNVSSPVAGLMIYQNSDNKFYFYDGSSWVAFATGILEPHKVVDSDADTYVNVEKSPDGDTIHFGIRGNEHMFLDDQHLHLLNVNNSLFIGQDAGLMNTAGVNLGIGTHANRANTGGDSNTILGNFASDLGSGQSWSTIIGTYAGRNNTADGSTFVGYRAGLQNTSGTNNTFVGFYAGDANQTGNYNTTLGWNAGRNTTSDNNTLIGARAGETISNAHNNTYVGFESGFNTTASSFNVAIGPRALYSQENGWYNVAIGAKAAESSTGGQNLAIGTDALRNNISGFSNTVIGNFAAHDASTSQSVIIGSWSGRFNQQNDQTFVGYASGASNSLGASNTHIGFRTGQFNEVGSNNTTLGYEAGKNLLTSNNTLAGMQTGFLLASGERNTAFGTQSGYNNISGSGNIFLGHQSGYNETGSDKLYIENSSSSSPLIYGDFSADSLIVFGSLGVQGNYTFPQTDGATNQVLSTDGNGVISWSNNDDADADPMNEIQDLTLSSDILTVTNNIAATDIDLSPYLDNTDEQTLSINMDSLEISTGNKVNLADYKNNISKIGKDSIAISFGDTLSLVTTHISDVDTDTYIKSEKTMDEDTLYFAVGGSEYMKLTDKNLDLDFGNFNILIGEGSGDNLDPSAQYTTTLGSNSLSNNNSGSFNTAVGTFTLRDNQTGQINTVVGSNAMVENESGSSNVAIGNQALRNNLGADFNTSVGTGSMKSNTSGEENVAIGFEALKNQTSGNSNTGIGFKALESNLTGSENTAIGHQAGLNILGENNIAIGKNAYIGSGSGNLNIAIGTSTMNTTGSSNVAIGHGSIGAFGVGSSNFNSSQNTVVGYQAGRRLDGGDRNVYLGSNAAYENRNGNDNVAIGESAGFEMRNTSSSNTLIGTRAGYNVRGNSNIMLGFFAGVSEQGSNRLYIDNNGTSTPIIYGELDNDLLRINGTFQVHQDSNEVMSTSYNTTDNYGEVTIKDVMTLTPRTDPPTTPSKGMIYYNDTDNLIYYYNGSGWVSL